MPIPANRAKIQIARGDYTDLTANAVEFAEGELSYAKDQNLLYIKEAGQLIRLEYVTTTDLFNAVDEAIELQVDAGEGLEAVYNNDVPDCPAVELSVDKAWLRETTGITDSKEPTGFVDKTTTVIAYRPTEQKFWLYPTGSSAAVWCQGQKYTFTSYKEVSQPTSTGVYYIYLDSSATLQIKTTEFDYKLDTPVCQVYWNQSSGEPALLIDRRHGIAMNWATQEFLELSDQSVVKDGFGISGITSSPDGSTDDHAKFAIANGTTLFQDVKISVEHNATPASNVASNLFQQVLTPAARLPVFYRDSTGWVFDSVNDFSYLVDTSTPAYNEYTTAWQKTQVTDGNYFISYVASTGNTEYPLIAISGQDEYTELSAATAAAFADLELGDLSVVHFRLLYKIIFKYDTAYTNTSNVTIEDYQDLRKTGRSDADGLVADHGRLTGLLDDDHTQYVHISNNRTITANHTHAGIVNISNTTAVASDRSTAALIIAGGVAIEGDLNIGGDVAAILDGGNF